jgi:hypothetical protein
MHIKSKLIICFTSEISAICMALETTYKLILEKLSKIYNSIYLRIFENRVLNRIFVTKKDEVMGG